MAGSKWPLWGKFEEISVSRVIVALFVAVLAIVVAISLYTNLNNVDQIPPPPQSRAVK
jgi:hypothetical protein